MPLSTERIYMLTELGKREGRDIAPRGRDHIIDHLFSHQTARLSEISSLIGKSDIETRHTLRPYIKRNLIQELT